MHPADALRGSKDRSLQDRQIVLCVTGSIAAVETVKLARMLVRHGAQVHPVMTRAAHGIIHPHALEFACGRPPVVELTGAVEHVDLCGLHPDRADLILVAPATANTISKIARGVDDTPVTTIVSTALGTGIPVMISPAMHGSMYQNPFVTANLEDLESAARDGLADVTFIQPIEEENKAKLAPLELITSEVLRKIGRRDLVGRPITIISGAGFEPIDDMRILTNQATGRTGILLALEAYHRGADVKLIQGRGELPPLPPGISVTRFGTNGSLMEIIGKIPMEGEGEDMCFLTPAAITDYTTVRKPGKIPSGTAGLSLELAPTPKAVELIRERFPRSRLIGFKAQSDMAGSVLEQRARKRMEELGAFMMVANDLARVGVDETEAMLLSASGGRKDFKGPKAQLAVEIMNVLADDGPALRKDDESGGAGQGGETS